ncbi:CCD82 protein, partial [Atractosteus spatula]|nr:CCD82 protein [Atractosteus spatula]
MDAASPKEHHLGPRPDLNCEHEKGQIQDLSVLPIKRKRTESSDLETDILAFETPSTIPNVEKDKKKQAVQFGVRRKLDVNGRKTGMRSPESGDTAPRAGTGDGERVEREVLNCDVEGGNLFSQGNPTAGAVRNSSASGVSNNCGGNNRSQNKSYISIAQDSDGGDGVSENRDHYFDDSLQEEKVYRVRRVRPKQTVEAGSGERSAEAESEQGVDGISTNKDSCRQTLQEDEMYHAKGKCTQTFFTAVSLSSGLDAECTGSFSENGNGRIDETEGSSQEDDIGRVKVQRKNTFVITDSQSSTECTGSFSENGNGRIDETEGSSQEDDIGRVKVQRKNTFIITDSQSSNENTGSFSDNVIVIMDSQTTSVQTEYLSENVNERSDSAQSSLETKCSMDAENEDSYNSSSEDDFGNFGAYTTEEEQREKIRRLFQREGLITVSGTGFDVHFDRVIKALITNAVNENFLESLYGKRVRKGTEEDMKQSLDRFDQDTIEPRLQALKPARSWQRNYLNRLENYSCIDIDTCSAVERKCQACFMDRMCKYSITLSGPSYDKKILKMEQFLKDNKRVVLVGSLCAEKTRLYHQLRHFKYNLYQECVSEVKKEDFDKNKPDEAVKQIFSKLHDCGWIEQQRCIIKNLIEEADGFHQKAKEMIAGMKLEWGDFYG